jgi:hypothetical protein
VLPAVVVEEEETVCSAGGAPAPHLNRRASLVLGHDYLLGELIPQLRDVGDDADHLAAHPQTLEGLGDKNEGVGIEGAEALVDEEAVQIHRPNGALNLVAELQDESQRGQECLSSAERVADPRFVGVVVVDDPDLVVVELQRVTFLGQHQQPGRGPLHKPSEYLLKDVRLEFVASQVVGKPRRLPKVIPRDENRPWQSGDRR